VCKYGLARVQAFSDMSNFSRFEDLGSGRNLRHTQVNPLPALIRQRVGQWLPQIVVDIHLDLLCHIVLLQAFQFRYHRTKISSLRSGQIFLLVLIQQKKQVKVVSVFQIQIHVPIAAALAFSSSRVRCSSLAYSARPLSDITLFGIPEQVLLYPAMETAGK
jgi:hypothetical protein